MQRSCGAYIIRGRQNKLTQFVAMAQLMNTTYVKELEIVASEPEDASRILDYMMSGKV